MFILKERYIFNFVGLVTGSSFLFSFQFPKLTDEVL